MTCNNIDSVELIPGHTSKEDLDVLYAYAVKIDWGGTPENKHIAMLIRDLIQFHGNACKQISECASMDYEMEDSI